MRRTLMAILLASGFGISIQAQTKAPAQPPDYGQWESLATTREFGGLSPDGKWLAYGINRSNRNNELRVTNVADGTQATDAVNLSQLHTERDRAVGRSQRECGPFLWCLHA